MSDTDTKNDTAGKDTAAKDRPKPEAAAPARAGTGRSRSGPKRADASAPAQVRRRRSRFLIASVQAPGVQPFSAGGVVDLLSSIPDVEVVRRIEAPRMLGLQSLEGSTPGVVVAEMADDKADMLARSGQGRFNVERDDRLHFALDPTVLPARLNPGVLVPSAAGFEATFEIRGPDGPIDGAEVHLFGALFPAVGRTDSSGRVTLALAGEVPEDVRSLYVKPRSGHWDFWMTEPQIDADAVNPVTLRPIELPPAVEGAERPMGWGARAMGLHLLPRSMDGTGVKVAVIDSGAAQATHRNLSDLGPGISLIGDDAAAWSVDSIGHGSHCAGVVGGTVDETGGLWGFAPGAEIHICRVFPGGRFSDLIGAIDYCIENGIDVASMSLGSSDGSQILADRIARGRARSAWPAWWRGARATPPTRCAFRHSYPPRWRWAR